MFDALIVAARDRKRLSEISGVITRFGLTSLVAKLGLASDADEDTGSTQSQPERVRLALEALGPTFVKLGQILATRSDLLSPEWIAELEKLHSTAPMMDFEALRGSVEASLGASPESLFSRFDAEPFAAASIAQIHRAALIDGTEVVLKVRRPGIRAQMEADLRLATMLAAMAERSAAIARYQPREIIRLLAEAVLEELDFTNEARNAERFAANFRKRSAVVIPRIHWAYTSEDLLVMDYVEGVRPTDAVRLIEAGIDPRAIASLGADTVFDMVLVDGLFHADPHPGNLLCQPGNKIALLDFGMVGVVSPRRREEMLGFVQSLVGRDPTRLADILAGWTENTAPDPALLSALAERLVERHGSGRLILARVVQDAMAMIREHALMLPADLILIFKALITIDGVLGRIDPEFDLNTASRKAFGRVMAARYAPDAVRDRLSALLLDLAVAEDNLPRMIRGLSARLSDPASPREAPAPHSDANRIVWAILLGAAMVSAAILIGPL